MRLCVIWSDAILIFGRFRLLADVHTHRVGRVGGVGGVYRHKRLHRTRTSEMGTKMGAKRERRIFFYFFIFQQDPRSCWATENSQLCLKKKKKQKKKQSSSREASQLFSLAFYLSDGPEYIGSCNIPSAFMIACRDQSFVSTVTFSSSSSSSFGTGRRRRRHCQPESITRAAARKITDAYYF